MTRVPSDEVLAEVLATVLRPRAAGEMQLLARTSNPYANTSHSEIVTYSFGNGPVQVFCKYGRAASSNSDGPRGGLSYEALVYRHVLRRFSGPPRFYGSVPLGPSTECLVFEHLAGSVRITRVPSEDEVLHAAAWIGSFHAGLEEDRGICRLPFLRHHDAAYYLGWVHRARAMAPNADGPPMQVLESFLACVDLLLDAPLTVVHGEYFPRSVLVQSGRVRPVAWESSAIAAGEIDLAALTEGWPAATVAGCESAYCRARWPGSSPEHFEATLAAARMYLHLRRLSHRSKWNAYAGAEWTPPTSPSTHL